MIFVAVVVVSFQRLSGFLMVLDFSTASLKTIKFLPITLHIEQFQNCTMSSNSGKARNNKLLREKNNRGRKKAKPNLN